MIAANGRATGTLVLTAPDGRQRRVQVFAAVVHWRDNQVQRIRLRTREIEPVPGDEITVILYPAGEDCLIYTTAGTGIDSNATFEAQGRLAVIR